MFNLALDVITTEVLPDVNRDDLLRELGQMLGEKIWVAENQS